MTKNTLGFWLYYICQNLGPCFSYFCGTWRLGFWDSCDSIFANQKHGALQCVELSSQELWTWFSHLVRNSSPISGIPEWQSWSFSLRVPSPFDYDYYGFIITFENCFIPHLRAVNRCYVFVITSFFLIIWVWIKFLYHSYFISLKF